MSTPNFVRIYLIIFPIFIIIKISLVKILDFVLIFFHFKENVYFVFILFSLLNKNMV